MKWSINLQPCFSDSKSAPKHKLVVYRTKIIVLMYNINKFDFSLITRENLPIDPNTEMPYTLFSLRKMLGL